MRLARSILAHSLAEATRAGYKSAVASLARFCTQQKLTLSFPVSADTLALWMASNASALTYSTIRVYLHGIGTTHVELGYASPLDSKLIWRMFTAVKRLQGAKAAQQKLPVTTELLQRLDPFQTQGSVAGLSKRAAMWLGTCGLLRSGEFAVRGKHACVLQRQHLVFLNDAMKDALPPAAWQHATCVRVHIAASKTDPFRQGVDVLVGNKQAVRAMATYLTRRGITAGTDPLFVGADGALSVAELVAHMRALLQAAGVRQASKYAGHSFRRGGATSLHYAGVPDSLIRVMGRWRSFTFARYIDVDAQRVLAAGRSMTETESASKSVSFAGQKSLDLPSLIWE